MTKQSYAKAKTVIAVTETRGHGSPTDMAIVYIQKKPQVFNMKLVQSVNGHNS
jgi:hypothetical protein